MDAREFQDMLVALFRGDLTRSEIDDFIESIRHAESFEDACLLTGNMGVVVEMKDGEEYQLSMCGHWR